MAFWSTERVVQRCASEGIVSPFNATHVDCGAYELSLGPEVYVTSDAGVKKTVALGEQVKIPPGQFGLLTTEEEVHIPLDAIGWISIKAGIKFQGLVNVSGFHVDPGFKGRLKYSVYNAGPNNIVLQRGMPTFLIWLADLSQKTEAAYEGKHQGQTGIDPTDVARISTDVVSPAVLADRLGELEARIEKLDHRLLTYAGIGGAILATFLGAIIDWPLQ